MRKQTAHGKQEVHYEVKSSAKEPQSTFASSRGISEPSSVWVAKRYLYIRTLDVPGLVKFEIVLAHQAHIFLEGPNQFLEKGQLW